MKRKVVFCAVAYCLMSALVHAESDARLETAKQQAQQMADAMVQGDDKTFARLTYAKVLEMNGGSEKMAATMESGRRQMASDETQFLRTDIGEPHAVIQGSAMLFTFVPETIHMTVRGGRLIQKSFLLGVSTNQGQAWTFIDAAGLVRHPERMPEVLPDFPKDAVLPVIPKPVFEPAR